MTLSHRGGVLCEMKGEVKGIEREGGRGWKGRGGTGRGRSREGGRQAGIRVGSEERRGDMEGGREAEIGGGIK